MPCVEGGRAGGGGSLGLGETPAAVGGPGSRSSRFHCSYPHFGIPEVSADFFFFFFFFFLDEGGGLMRFSFSFLFSS